MEWQRIETAPTDGTRIIGRIIDSEGQMKEQHVTWWGKTSHVPIYGWNHGQVENLNLWKPTHWRSLDKLIMPFDQFFASTSKRKPRKRSAYILMRKKMKQKQAEKTKVKPVWNARTLDF